MKPRTFSAKVCHSATRGLRILKYPRESIDMAGLLRLSQQEGQHDAFELVLAFDHRPMPAVVEDMQLAAGDEAHRAQGAVERGHPVVAAPGQQRRRLDLRQHREGRGIACY